MNILKMIFPVSFAEKNDIVSLLINIAIYLVGGAIIGAVLGFATSIPFLGIIFGIAAGLVGAYSFVGIVLSLLDYFKILK